MSDAYLDLIKRRVLAVLLGENVSIGLFGSFASGLPNRSSDVDIAIVPKGSWDEKKLTLLREEFEESTIPYKVELVDFSRVQIEFQALALNSVIWWRQ